MVKILDASALMVYLEKESGYEKVKDMLVKAAQTNQELLMTTINLGEVYYVLHREYGGEQAAEILQMIETFPIKFINVDLDLAKQAAVYKAIKKLPFADCFAAALAKLKKGELVTKDKDFKVIEDDVKVLWL